MNWKLIHQRGLFILIDNWLARERHHEASWFSIYIFKLNNLFLLCMFTVLLGGVRHSIIIVVILHTGSIQWLHSIRVVLVSYHFPGCTLLLRNRVLIIARWSQQLFRYNSSTALLCLFTVGVRYSTRAAFLACTWRR